MAIYTVVVKDSSKREIVENAVKRKFLNSEIYNHSDNVFFVSLKEMLYLDDIAQAIGFSADQKISGFIVKTSTIQGWDSPKLWEWMERDA